MWYENVLFKETIMFIRNDSYSPFGGASTSVENWFDTNLSYLFPKGIDLTHVEMKY